MQVDHIYYITHTLIPPLERIFNLVGADVMQWFTSMRKSYKADDYMEEKDEKNMDIPNSKHNKRTPGTGSRLKIDGHFQSSQCAVCGVTLLRRIHSDGVCEECKSRPSSISELLGKLQQAEQRLINVQRICASCSHVAVTEPIECESVDCSWLYERVKATRKAAIAIEYKRLAAVDREVV